MKEEFRRTNRQKDVKLYGKNGTDGQKAKIKYILYINVCQSQGTGKITQNVLAVNTIGGLRPWAKHVYM